MIYYQQNNICNKITGITVETFNALTKYKRKLQSLSGENERED